MQRLSIRWGTEPMGNETESVGACLSLNPFGVSCPVARESLNCYVGDWSYVCTRVHTFTIHGNSTASTPSANTMKCDIMDFRKSLCKCVSVCVLYVLMALGWGNGPPMKEWFNLLDTFISWTPWYYVCVCVIPPVWFPCSISYMYVYYSFHPPPPQTRQN